MTWPGSDGGTLAPVRLKTARTLPPAQLARGPDRPRTIGARCVTAGSIDHAVVVSSRRENVQLILLGAGAFVVQTSLLHGAWEDGSFAIDFEQTLRPAAEAVAAGDSPYPAYGYPPLVAFVLAPLTLLPGPSLLLAAALALCVPATLLLLGVRDPRCHAAAFLWAPVYAAIQTANVTLVLLVGVAVAWRYRDTARRAAVAGGLAVAAKLLCWPLGLWLAATRRRAAALGAGAVALGVTLGLWALLGFDGLRGYPSSLRGLEGEVGSDAYTVQALLVDAGLRDGAAGVVGAVVAAATLAAVVVVGLRGDDRRSFTLAVAAMLLATPITWLHSFALLLAPVALARPRLSAVWLLPAVTFVASGTGNGAPWQTALVLGVAAALVADALRRGRGAPADAVGEGLAPPVSSDALAHGLSGNASTTSVPSA